MTIRKKRFLGILLSFALMLGMLPMMSLTAQAATNYALYVGETRVTSDNASDVFGDGTVSFDRDSLTLKLKNYTYKGEGYNWCGIYASYDKFTIQIDGVNTVECTETESTGIYNSKTGITITGSGTLNALGAYEGIECKYGDLTIESGTVNAIATDTVDEMSHVGIYCEDGDVVIKGGTLTAIAKCGDNGENNFGIWSNNVKITGGKLIATGAKGSIQGNVINSIAGTGWTDVEGTAGKAAIPINTTGQSLENYKNVQFPPKEDPKPAPVIKAVTVNTAIVSKKAIDKAIKKAGGKAATVITITLGKKVKKISAKAFASYKKAATLVVKTKKLTKKSVKSSLKGSKIKTVKVKVGSKKVNKAYKAKYKKIFTKKNAGKKVKIV